MSTNNTHTNGARSRTLYRTVLSLAVAALIAASIPFAAIYVGSLQHPPTLAALAPSSATGSTRLVTTASGRQIAVPAGVNPATALAAARVTTRTSGGAGSGD